MTRIAGAPHSDKDGRNSAHWCLPVLLLAAPCGGLNPPEHPMAGLQRRAVSLHAKEPIDYRQTNLTPMGHRPTLHR